MAVSYGRKMNRNVHQKGDNGAPKCTSNLTKMFAKREFVKQAISPPELYFHWRRRKTPVLFN